MSNFGGHSEKWSPYSSVYMWGSGVVSLAVFPKPKGNIHLLPASTLLLAFDLVFVIINKL